MALLALLWLCIYVTINNPRPPNTCTKTTPPPHPPKKTTHQPPYTHTLSTDLAKGLPPGAGVFVVCDAVIGAPVGVFQVRSLVRCSLVRLSVCGLAGRLVGPPFPLRVPCSREQAALASQPIV